MCIRDRFSVAFAIFLLVRRFIVGAEVEGVFTLFAILFFFIGITIFGIGIVGEYVGRISRKCDGGRDMWCVSYTEWKKNVKGIDNRLLGHG